LPSKTDQVIEARALYGRGLSVQDVARAVGVSVATIYRWKAKDEGTAGDWDGRRDEYRTKDPRAVITILEQRLVELVERKDLDPGAYADAVHKLHGVLSRVREEYGDISTVLGVLGGLAAWVHGRSAFTDDDLAVLRRVTDAYLDHLKREYST
jgi:transposase